MTRIVLSFILASLLVGCSKDSDEKAIRELIEMMQATAEKKEFSKTLEPVTSDYEDNLNGNRQGVGRRLDEVFGPFDRLIIKAPIQKIEKNPLSATATMKVYVMGAKDDAKVFIFGTPITPKNVDVYLEKRQGRWRVTGSLISR